MKGGHGSSGPAPDPNALARERDAAQWTILPAGGRVGDPPDWPLTKASARELQWWARLWAYPQAQEWEKLGQAVEVAVYVRRLTQAEKPGAPVNLGTLLRQLADALGLTIPGMLRLRWHLSAPQAASLAQAVGHGPASAAPHPPAPSSRGRFQVIRGDAER